MENKQKKEYIRHAWTVLCQNSSTDNQTNALSLFNIIEEITVELSADFEKNVDQNGLVVVPIQFQLISLWNRMQDKKEELIGNVQITLKDPENKLIQNFEYNLVIPSDKKRMRFNVNLNGIKINPKISGDYIFEVSLMGPMQTDFHKITELPLYIIVNKPVKK